MRARRQPYIDTIKRRTGGLSASSSSGSFSCLYPVVQHPGAAACPLQKQAARCHNRRIQVDAVRGILYDRQRHRPDSEPPLKSVYADPSLIDDPAATALQSAEPLDRSPMPREVSPARGLFAWLRRKVDRETEQAVRRSTSRIDFVPETKRGRIHSRRGRQPDRLHRYRREEGVEGAEQQLQETIAKPGWVKAEVDARRIIPPLTSAWKRWMAQRHPDH